MDLLKDRDVFIDRFNLHNHRYQVLQKLLEDESTDLQNHWQRGSTPMRMYWEGESCKSGSGFLMRYYREYRKDGKKGVLTTAAPVQVKRQHRKSIERHKRQ